MSEGMSERDRLGKAGMGCTLYLKTRRTKKDSLSSLQGDSSPARAPTLPVSGSVRHARCQRTWIDHSEL